MSSPSESSAGNEQPGGITAQASKSTTFDYSKRKRWLDLVLAEIGDALAFILTPNKKVVFCTGCGGAEMDESGPGWTDTDFLGSEFTDFINKDDLEHFQNDFQLALEGKDEENDITTYARLRPQPSPTILPAIKLEEVPYELRIRAHIHPSDPDSTIVVIGATQQYSWAGLACLTSTLMHERDLLQNRLDYLKSLLPPDFVGEVPTPEEPGDDIYSSSDLTNKSAEQSTGDEPSGSRAPAKSQSIPGESEDPGDVADDGGRKKKRLKKTTTVEQHVCITCGRTNSPEWRKGPLGPKTLCNACGLRWAKQKQIRKAAETQSEAKSRSTEEGEASSTPELERSKSPT